MRESYVQLEKEGTKKEKGKLQGLPTTSFHHSFQSCDFYKHLDRI